jgi:hypothetical protein
MKDNFAFHSAHVKILRRRIPKPYGDAVGHADRIVFGECNVAAHKNYQDFIVLICENVDKSRNICVHGKNEKFHARVADALPW